MVTGGQFLVRPVVSLVDILSPPEDPVCPGRGSAFLAGVPVAGAEVVFVGRPEPYGEIYTAFALIGIGRIMIHDMPLRTIERQ